MAPDLDSSAAHAVSRVKSGMRVFVHGAAATPTSLLDAMLRRLSKRVGVVQTVPWVPVRFVARGEPQNPTQALADIRRAKPSCDDAR